MTISKDSTAADVRNKLLASQNDPEGEDSEELTPEVIEPTPSPQLEAKPGEVLFECECDNQPIKTALSNGRCVALPYVATTKEDIDELTAFAEHVNASPTGGNVKITKG